MTRLAWVLWALLAVGLLIASLNILSPLWDKPPEELELRRGVS